jgi:Leucine-rich repeat (LRR) protein
VSLRVLNLAANELTQIPNLRGLSHLTELYLGHNKIEEIQHLDLLPQLQILDLKFNRIKTVDGLHNNHYLQKYVTLTHTYSNIKNEFDSFGVVYEVEVNEQN